MGSDDGTKKNTSSCCHTKLCTVTAAATSKRWIKTISTMMQSQCPRNFLHHCDRKHIVGSSLICVVLFLLITQCVTMANTRIYMSPEYQTTATFQRRSSIDFDYLPSHCRAIAKEFDACQERKQAQTTTTISSSRYRSRKIIPTVVFSCHRKWCQSLFGHCEPCSGLGDRYRFLISQIDTIFSVTTKSSTIHKIYDEQRRPHDRKMTSLDDYICYTHLQIDAPTYGLQQIQSSLYIDPGGWFSELFHYRSYSVSKRELLPYKEILLQQQQQQQYPPPPNSTHYYYTHFTPNKYGFTSEYNACYFHIVYKPDDQLQQEIQYHRNKLQHLLSGSRQSASGNFPTAISSDKVETTKQKTTTTQAVTTTMTTIGIHYRTGDTVAFGIQNADERVHSDQLISGWKQLYDCSVALTKQLVQYNGNEGNSYYYDNVRFYLATDNRSVKDYVRQQHSSNQANESISRAPDVPFVPVYVTDIEPDSYIRGNSGDRPALLELYLLAGCDGIVANTLPSSGYNGTAASLSQFALLAKKIGFIPNTNFYECTFD